MYSSSKIAVMVYILAVFIVSVYCSNLEVFQAFQASSSDMEQHRLYKRKPISIDRFAFAEESENDDKDSVALSCCPCGGHHCCGSMCHG